MKLAVIWHLIGVLLINGALATVIHIEEAVTSATTTTTAAVRAPPVVVARERKLPRLDHVNGLKKPPPKSEILVQQQQQQQQQQQNSPDESTSTTSRSFRPDYLAAKNTVPVAVAPTEATFRKFSRPRLIPGPSPALLAVKAASASSSTTERGLDSSIPPTGWALAALGPSSSRGTTGFGGKRFSSPSTIVKPISTFWSTRLFKTTTSSSFPEMLDLQDEPHNATTVRAQPENEESMEENIGTTATTPLTTTTTTTTTTSTTTTTTTSTTSTPTTTVTIDPEIENLPPATPPVKITESNETVSNVTATTMTTTSSTTPMTTSDASTVPPSSTTTVLADNLIKRLQYASNEINGTTTSTTITTPTITLLPPFGNNTEENTIATPMAKSNTIEESLGSTKSEIQDLSSTTTPEMEEMTIGTATIGKSVASTTEIPALVVTTTTPVEETTVVTGTDQTLKTLAKSNSTSKIITAVMNETTTETQPSVATTTPLPSSTLSNDIPDVAKSGKNKPPVVVNSTETAGNYIPISTPAVQVGEDLNVVNRSTVPPQIQNCTEYSSGINETTTAVETSTETLNHSKNEIKSLEFDNKIDRTKQIQPTIFPSTTTDSTTSHPQGHAVTNLNNFHYDLDNKTETPAVILNEGGGSGDSDEDDDTLKYNVTGGVHHDDGHPDDYDDFDQVSSPPQGNVTTEIPVGTVNDTKNELGRTITTTTVSTSPSTVATTVSIVSVSETTTYVFDHTIPGEDEDDEESVIVPMNVRVHIQASYKQMCLAKEMFRNTIVAALSEETTKPVERDQVEILNLGPNECDGLTSTDGDVIPINLLLMTPQGKYDRSLTEILFSLIKHGRLNFKFPITQVDKLVSQMLEPPVHQMGGTVILAIIISSIAGICLLFLTILIVIMRKRQKGFNYGQRCTPVSLDDYSLDNISVCNSVRRKAMRASKRSYGNPAFDDPVALTNPLNFAGLVNAVSDKSKIEEEFDRVPVVSVKPDELPPGAESKNRYANVIPLPETRVQLNGPSTNLTGNSDADHFINANYVKGPKGADKFYVACQAPLQNTVADFWQMIWEQQSRVIIMLTDLHENGVEKSADYLPPSEVLDCHRVFGDLQVTLKKREVRDKYVISSLQLKNLVSNLWREVTHLWYSGWPTRGVPDDCSSMIAFLIEARSYSKAGPPVVVHCSPGTGRTGTVIAIDTAIRDYETTRTVDIPKTVYNIRRDRAGAVQTSQQYLFIYQVLHLYATKLAGGGLDSI